MGGGAHLLHQQTHNGDIGMKQPHARDKGLWLNIGSRHALYHWAPLSTLKGHVNHVVPDAPCDKITWTNVLHLQVQGLIIDSIADAGIHQLGDLDRKGERLGSEEGEGQQMGKFKDQ